MNSTKTIRFLFIINTSSGTNTTDWSAVISDYFIDLNHDVSIYQLPDEFNHEHITEQIEAFSPQRVIAVGGDGTIKLVAECLLRHKISLGILPAGSANGLAKELGIPDDNKKALDIILNGVLKKIHLININNHICIHLSDIGLNAHTVKKFEALPGRGMWGYFQALLKVIRINTVMKVDIRLHNQVIRRYAHMIVIANATRYGSGAVINPIGALDDSLFEIIVVKKISITELFKMIFSHKPYDTNKTEVIQTDQLSLQTVRKVHFQIDGEYLGKTSEVNAYILPDALEVIVPDKIN